MSESLDDGWAGREPQQLPEVYYAGARVYSLIYPPIGFLPFYEIGNGDDHGYYWPLGREESPPLIAMSSHDTGSIIPENSQIVRFYACQVARERAELEDEEDEFEDSFSSADEYRSIVEAAIGKSLPDDVIAPVQADDIRGLLELDPESPFLLTAVGDLCMQDNDVEQAIHYYGQAVEHLPEYVAAHFALALAYRRQRQRTEAMHHLREALVGNPVFYGGSFWAETWLPGNKMRNDWRRKSLMWLQQYSQQASVDDPLIAAACELQFQEGVKESPDFEIFESLIVEYLDRGQPVEAVKIWMLYGHRAAEETVSFRSRLGLTSKRYGERLIELLDLAKLNRRAQLVRDMVTRLQSPEGNHL